MGLIITIELRFKNMVQKSYHNNVAIGVPMISKKKFWISRKLFWTARIRTSKLILLNKECNGHLSNKCPRMDDIGYDEQ